MIAADALDRGREAFHRQAWGAAYSQLAAAAAERALELADLENLAVAAFLNGRDVESEEAWTTAHHESLKAADWARAARCAFWLGITLLNRLERARGSGWIARAHRVLDDAQHECVERGLLLIPLALSQYYKGDLEGSGGTWAEAVEIGMSYHDVELVTIARQGQGRVLIRLGRTAEGLALLDEAMVAVAAGEVSAIPAGIVYCSVIEACQEILDIRRAHEWTMALSRWVAAQPALVPYRGRCLVHRSEILQLNGSWPEALEEARRACDWLSRPPQPQLGMAYYQRAELHRLRGQFAEAEEAYRKASRWGRSSQPGLALLRLAQGRVDVAAARIRRAADEAKDAVSRARVLPAYIEIMLATGDAAAARPAADELLTIADHLDVPFVRGVAACAEGAVLLAEGQASAALDALRNAAQYWEELELPYEVARLRIVIALACRGLGDGDGAEMELDSARRVFQQLGAAPDLARVEALSQPTLARTAGGLSAREVQVLALAARGKSNREIGAELIISDRTVARHMSNIFSKLNVSSRTAASAFAFEHELV
jgi:DNA-binding NarL/FixJ family response regulator